MDYTKLTNEQIDRLVAERVMHWQLADTGNMWIIVDELDENDETWMYKKSDYHPSCDINQAFEAIEKNKCCLDIMFYPLTEKNRWFVANSGTVYKYVYTDTPARAICIALIEAEEAGK